MQQSPNLVIWLACSLITQKTDSNCKMYKLNCKKYQMKLKREYLISSEFALKNAERLWMVAHYCAQRTS